MRKYKNQHGYFMRDVLVSWSLVPIRVRRELADWVIRSNAQTAHRYMTMNSNNEIAENTVMTMHHLELFSCIVQVITQK